MRSVYEELDRDKRWYTVYWYCVYKFAQNCLEPCEDRKISETKLVGYFYDWCEQMGILRGLKVSPSLVWSELCHLIDEGEIPGMSRILCF
ncbi:MAG: hypothetical protein ACI4NN_04705 [Pyramidobacter sp.]